MSRSKHILVVEDEGVVAGLIQHVLLAHEYQVTIVSDGESAWSLLQSDAKFEAILLDRGLPKLDGLALLKRIKSDGELRHIPVVMETGQDDIESVREGIDAGAYYYLTKPLAASLLLSVLNAAIEQRQDYLAMQQLSGREPAQALRYMTSGTYRCRTLREAHELAGGLTYLCPDPARVGLGLQELLVNAIEHGNLEISYDEKTALMISDSWQKEVERRLVDQIYCERVVTVHVMRNNDSISFTIKDEGCGFAYQNYLEISPERSFHPHGRGIAMSRMISFDSITYQGNGNTVTAIVLIPIDGEQSHINTQ